ncbi:MAG: hypothetical protein ACFFFG_03495 [Candidatus Thorarchaeota archaeon]
MGIRLNAEPEKTEETEFFLAHIVFDEEAGPSLKSYLAHHLEIPRIILQGVTTTLFTMAIGVGEPTGEPDTAIIPINVTGIQGRVLIHSFSLPDPSVRGKNRIESLMLFVPRIHQDKLLQHSLSFSNILQEAIRDIKTHENGNKAVYPLEKVFNNIKKVILTRIDNTTQDRISEVLTEKEKTVIVSNGTIRAFHNVSLSPEIISLVSQISSLLRDWGEEIKTSGTFFDTIPLEIHANTLDQQQFYLLAVENTFILAFSSGKGRLGSLFRIFREIIWDLNLQSSMVPSTIVPRFRIQFRDASELFPNDPFLDKTVEVLKSFHPIITEVSLIRCACESRTLDMLRTTTPNGAHRHALVCQMFSLIHNVARILSKDALRQLVLSQHIMNSLVLRVAQNSEKSASLFLVGDSSRGVGLLKLVSEQLLETKITSESQDSR